MIYQPGPVSMDTKQSDHVPQLVDLDTRLAADGVADGHGSDADELYEQLKKLWTSNPAVTSTEIINCLRDFKTTEGLEPYKDIRSHVSAIAQVMKKLDEEGGGGTPIYTTLKGSLSFAVVSEGVLTSFIGKMMERPEDPEPW